MALFLIITAAVIFACIIFNRVSAKLGIPMLLAFIVLGMLFGSDGIVKIPFDNYVIAEQVCSVALIFIIFYGGFGTKWSEARPTAVKAVWLSSMGTVLTALLVGLFCYFVLKITFWESFLIGSVISSTDAASVFSVLRSKRLNLKYGTASLLEVESGSNDPFSYMLTVLVLSVMNGSSAGGEFWLLLLKQLVFGAVFGVGIAFLAWKFLNNFKFLVPGFDTACIVGTALIAYAAPAYFGGNGYLAAYITGIILGNLRIRNKKALVNFFDAITGLMQMLLFFLLGLLSFPSQLPSVAFKAFAVWLFLTFAARPMAVFAVLTPFKSTLEQKLLVSWAGLRGAASIVFAIMATINPAVTDNDIFHMVFFIVIFSILFQGTLVPYVSRLLKMNDDRYDVMRTFNDYSEKTPVEFIQLSVNEGNSWAGKRIRDIVFPPDTIAVLVVRNGEKIVPSGSTEIMENDTVVLMGRTAAREHQIELYEKKIEENHPWADRAISELGLKDELVVIIYRSRRVIIPKGATVIRTDDILVMSEPAE